MSQSANQSVRKLARRFFNVALTRGRSSRVAHSIIVFLFNSLMWGLQSTVYHSTKLWPYVSNILLPYALVWLPRLAWHRTEDDLGFIIFDFAEHLSIHRKQCFVCVRFPAVCLQACTPNEPGRAMGPASCAETADLGDIMASWLVKAAGAFSTEAFEASRASVALPNRLAR